MFRPNCMAFFRLIFKRADCTADNTFNLRDLVLKELVNMIVVYYIKDEIKIQVWYFMQ